MIRINVIVTLLLLTTAAAAEIQVLAIDGAAAPEASGTFQVALADPATILGGRVTFATGVSAPAPAGEIVVTRQCGGNLVIVAEAGEALPNTNILDSIRNEAGPVANASGRIVFPARSYLASNPNAARTELITRAAGGIDRQIVSEGDAAPGGDGALFIRTALGTSVNGAGQIAFSGSLTGTTGGGADDEAVYLWDPSTDALTELVRKGDSLPGGGTYTGTVFQASDAFAAPFIAADGRVAFVAEVNGTVFGDNGVFVTDGGTPSAWLRYDAPIPTVAPTANFGFAWGIDFNDNGDLAVVVNHNSTSTSPDGVYRTDGSEVIRIAATGQTAPSGFPFRNFERSVKQDNAGKCVFGANLTTTSTPDGIYSGDGSTVTELALVGSPAPEGRGVFTLMGRYTISPGGYVAFAATTTTVEAIYRQRSGAIEEVVSTADSIDGSEIVDLELAGYDFADGAGVGDTGAVLFKFRLADGRDGIALGGVAVGSDTDGDGASDWCDNCTLAGNPDQRDVDGDGHGNICDPDFNQDCAVNFVDSVEMRLRFFSDDALIDLDGDGSVNFIDLVILRNLFFGTPGPSAGGLCSF